MHGALELGRLSEDDEALCRRIDSIAARARPNTSTVLGNKFLMETGSSELALTVKMSEKLALSAGYGITDNTDPPPTLKKLDTITTVNLVFAF